MTLLRDSNPKTWLTNKGNEPIDVREVELKAARKLETLMKLRDKLGNRKKIFQEQMNE